MSISLHRKLQSSKIYLNDVSRVDMVRKWTINCVLFGLCMFIISPSHAVKCIQSGFTEAEGAIKCYPYHMIGTWDRASVTGSIWRSFEPSNEVFNAISNPPYCGEISTSDTEPVIRWWGISNWSTGPSPRAHKTDDVEHYDIAYPPDPYNMPDGCLVAGTGHITIKVYREAAS